MAVAVVVLLVLLLELVEEVLAEDPQIILFKLVIFQIHNPLVELQLLR
jgi:hypothetical protein